MTDGEDHQAYRRTIEKLEDAQDEARKKLNKLNELEVTTTYLKERIHRFLWDLENNWGNGLTGLTGLTGERDDNTCREFQMFDEELRETSGRTFDAVDNERQRFENTQKELEIKQEELAYDYNKESRNKALQKKETRWS